MATGLPFLDGVEVVSTDVVDPNPIYDANTAYNDGDFVQKDGAVYQVVAEGVVVDLDTALTIEAGNTAYVSPFYYRSLLVSSLFPFDGNTENLPLTENTPQSDYYKISGSFQFDIFYNYSTTLAGDRIFYKFIDIGGGQYQLYYETKDDNGSLIDSGDYAVSVRTFSEDPRTFSTQKDPTLGTTITEYLISDDGNTLYEVNKTPSWKLEKQEYFEQYTPQLLYYSELLQNKPFDLQANTRATKSVSLEYVCKPSDSQYYNTIILDGLVGTGVNITINGVTTSHFLNSFEDGETVIQYTPSLISILDDVTIYVTYLTSGVAEIGTIAFANEQVDMGTTKFDIDFDLTDYSPQEEQVGGYIDYVEGVALETKTVNISEQAQYLPNILRNIKRFKKKLMAFDLTDSHIEEHFLSDIMKMVGRINESSVTLKSVAGIQENDIINGSYTIEQGS